MFNNIFRALPILITFITFIPTGSNANNLPSIPDSLENITYHDLYQMSTSDLENLAVELNKKLIMNSNNVHLNLLRAKIYLHEEKYKAAEGLLRRLSQIFPGNGEVNYFLSRLYSQTDSLALSYSYMYRIYSQNNYDEKFIRELENDALPFFNRFEKEVYDTTSNKVEYILLNWMRKDPYPASIENEYFESMIARLEYAYKNFFDGFALDDRGKIYLKYGAPEIRREFAHQGYQTECWIYKRLMNKDVSFDFIRGIKRPSWREVKFKQDIPGDSFISNKSSLNFDDSEPSRTFFEDRAMLSNRYQEIFAALQSQAISEEMDTGPAASPLDEQDFLLDSHFNRDNETKARLPEVVAVPKVPYIPLSVEYSRFKNDSNIVNLETYIGVSIRDVKNVVDGFINKKMVINEKLTIKDRTLFPVATHSDKINFTIDNTETAHFIDQLTFTVPADKFVIAYEVEDETKRFIASKVLEADNSDFIKDDLFLSDIQMSVGIKENVAPGKYTKHGLFIQPYPYLMYSKNSPIFIYFEIYNLVKSHSLTNYDISYGLAKSFEKNILEQIFTLDFSNNPGSIQFNQNYNGSSNDDFIYFQINAANLDIGEYVLRVKVTDKNSGKEFIRERKFFLTI